MTAAAHRVAVVGGGLAGLAAALALAERGFRVELFEARRTLGGRAGSFRDPATGDEVDHCQHVAMGCCTNYLDFCRRAGAFDELERIDTLHFFGPDGERCDFRGSRWLPAPLHLAPGLWGLKYLTRCERITIAAALGRLARLNTKSRAADITIGQWLARQGQSLRQIELFWSVVLLSALSDTVDRASLAAARKVFVDGFMANREGYAVYRPRGSLGSLYEKCVAKRLAELGVTIHRETPVRRLSGDARSVAALTLADGSTRAFDDYVLAVPWQRAAATLDDTLLAAAPQIAAAATLPAASIAAVHLWFDRPITSMSHAVLVGRLSQWVFAHGARPSPGGNGSADGASHYYQVVISASHELLDDDRTKIVARVREDLASIFQAAAQANVVHHRIVIDRDAVFAPTVDAERLRPAQSTSVENLFLAGDWTATGWPATMEGAVRSGYLAAEAILRRRLARSETILVPDPARGWLMRWMPR